MKINQRLFVGLFLIGSLFGVYPICSSDRSVVQGLIENMPNKSQGAALTGALLLGGLAYALSTSETGDTLQAVKEYLMQSPGLRLRQGVSAASLAFAYTIHRYCKSKPISVIVALTSLVPMYSVYKDILLVKDVQLAKASKKVSDERIKKYMDSLCFAPKFYYHGGKEWAQVSVYFGLFDGDKKLQMYFFRLYTAGGDKQKQLRRCAQDLLGENGFVAQEFLPVPSEHAHLEATRNNVDYHNKWISPLVLLDRLLTNRLQDPFLSENFTHGYSASFVPYSDTDPLNKMIMLYREIIGYQECSDLNIKNESPIEPIVQDLSLETLTLPLPDDIAQVIGYPSVTLDLNEKETFTLSSFKELIDEGKRSFVIALSQHQNEKWYPHIFDAHAFAQFGAGQRDEFRNPISEQIIKYIIPIALQKENNEYIVAAQ